MKITSLFNQKLIAVVLEVDLSCATRWFNPLAPGTSLSLELGTSTRITDENKKASCYYVQAVWILKERGTIRIKYSDMEEVKNLGKLDNFKTSFRATVGRSI